MWQFFDNKVLYIPDDSSYFEWKPFEFQNWKFSGHIFTIHPHHDAWIGYDKWVQDFSLEEELTIVQTVIREAKKNPQYRAHIRGISLAESVELLRKYYQEEGYEDSQAKNYALPPTAQVTVSITLRHALWCEKDKRFLGTRDKNKHPHGMISPPIRGSHDLRILQQALRMNIILGIEVFPGDEKYINTLVEQEILTPFSVSQMIRFRWERFSF